MIDRNFASIDVKDLTNFAVDIRYGDELYTPDIEEAKTYYELVKQIRNLVFAKLNIKDL